MSKRSRQDYAKDTFPNKRARTEDKSSQQYSKDSIMESDENGSVIQLVNGKRLLCILSYDGKVGTFCFYGNKHDWQSLTRVNAKLIPTGIRNYLQTAVDALLPGQIYISRSLWLESFADMQAFVKTTIHTGFHVITEENKFGITYCIYC